MVDTALETAGQQEAQLQETNGTDAEKKNASKGILVIVIVILFWMALWEFIGIIAMEWKRDLQLFFYGTVLFCVVLFIIFRPDVIPHF